MKLLKFISILLLLTILNSCKVGRFVYYNFADITDHKIFPKNTINKDSIPFLFKYKKGKSIPDSLIILKGGIKHKIEFEDYLVKNKTVALLVIKNDTIEYEKYFSKYDETSIVNSFSMAKSVTSILIGCAIDEGLITSTNDPITNYLPKLKKNGFEEVTIKHLLNMTSGIEFNESYLNPFGHAASFYYGTNLRNEISKLKLKFKPGTKFKYSSGDAQLLGMVLQAALKDRSISDYLEYKLWKPLGMEFDASWSLDRKMNGIEKTFCCLNARARDFAKIGRLYLNKGVWNGKRIISEEWVNSSTKIDQTDASVWYYQHQWWIRSNNGTFEAKGILGQRIYVNSKKNLVVVRLGKNDGKTANWTYFMEYLSRIYDVEQNEISSTNNINIR